MRGQWSLTQETLLKWFLATVLLSAGIITGMRFAGNIAGVSRETPNESPRNTPPTFLLSTNADICFIL